MREKGPVDEVDPPARRVPYTLSVPCWSAGKKQPGFRSPIGGLRPYGPALREGTGGGRFTRDWRATSSPTPGCRPYGTLGQTAKPACFAGVTRWRGPPLGTGGGGVIAPNPIIPGSFSPVPFARPPPGLGDAAVFHPHIGSGVRELLLRIPYAKWEVRSAKCEVRT